MMFGRGPLLAVAIACVALAAQCDPEPAGPVTGRWGGEHVELNATPDSASIEYDCASGTIDGPMIPGAGGAFTASGTHTPGQGGPVRVGEEPRRYPARYSGTVHGRRMTLLVAYRDRPDTVGRFALELGAEPRLFRCL